MFEKLRMGLGGLFTKPASRDRGFLKELKDTHYLIFRLESLESAKDIVVQHVRSLERAPADFSVAYLDVHTVDCGKEGHLAVLSSNHPEFSLGIEANDVLKSIGIPNFGANASDDTSLGERVFDRWGISSCVVENTISGIIMSAEFLDKSPPVIEGSVKEQGPQPSENL